MFGYILQDRIASLCQLHVILIFVALWANLSYNYNYNRVKQSSHCRKSISALVVSIYVAEYSNDSLCDVPYTRDLNLKSYARESTIISHFSSLYLKAEGHLSRVIRDSAIYLSLEAIKINYSLSYSIALSLISFLQLYTPYLIVHSTLSAVLQILHFLLR